MQGSCEQTSHRGLVCIKCGSKIKIIECSKLKADFEFYCCIAYYCTYISPGSTLCFIRCEGMGCDPKIVICTESIESLARPTKKIDPTVGRPTPPFEGWVGGFQIPEWSGGLANRYCISQALTG